MRKDWHQVMKRALECCTKDQYVVNVHPTSSPLQAAWYLAKHSLKNFNQASRTIFVLGLKKCKKTNKLSSFSKWPQKQPSLMFH
jgi:hypothetical protein